MTRIITLLSVYFLMCMSPALAQTLSDVNTIKQNIINMWAAVEVGDVDTYMTYVHEDYTVFGEGDIYLQAGKNKERASYTDYLGRVQNVKTFMHQPEVTVRRDTAWITYYWTDSGYSNAKDAKGKTVKGESFTTKGKSTRIFVKENGKWLCIHSHFTDVP